VLIGKAARAKRALRSVPADDTLSTSTPNPERPMPEVKTGEAVQLLDLMVEYFEDDAPWIRGQFYDGHEPGPNNCRPTDPGGYGS
jgi:hypothetical protein